MNPKSIRLAIDSRIENICLVGMAVNKICSIATLTQVERYQIELCLVEAVTNAIVHAYDRREDQQVEVEIEIHPRRIILRVSDYGRAMTRLDPPRLDFDPDDHTSLPEGGMGLFIINSVMSESSYCSEAGRNTLELVKYLPGHMFDRRSSVS